MLLASFGAGQVAYSFLWFFLFLIEIWLMLSVFIDVFRSHDLRGWEKALWIIFVLVIPVIGILAYLIVRGDRMRAHQVQAFGTSGYRPSASPWHSSTESRIQALHLLTQLRDRGEISADEYRALRAGLLDEDVGRESH